MTGYHPGGGKLVFKKKEFLMKRRLLIFAVVFALLCSSTFANNVSFSVSGGGVLPVAQYMIDDDKTTERDGYTSFMGGLNWQIDASVSYAFNDMISIGGTAGFQSNHSQTRDGMFTIPVYIDFSFTPHHRQVTFPMTVSLGCFGMFWDDLVTIGPAIKVSAGVDVGLTDWMSLFLKVQHEVLIAFYKDFSRTNVYYHMTPLSVGMRFSV